MNPPRIETSAFNELPAEAAVDLLASACASTAWQRVLAAGRPYGSPAQVAAASDGVITALGWNDVQEALAGDTGAGLDAVRASDAARAYEERFGVPFLIDPTGKTVAQMQQALTARLAAEPEAEQRAVRQELAAVVRLRLVKLLV